MSYYKIFYIAVFLVFCWSFGPGSRRDFRRQGFWQDAKWLFIFFSYLLLTAVWALYPSATLITTAVYSIFLVLWAVSYVLGQTYKAERVAGLFVALPYVVVIAFVYMFVRFGALRPYDQTSLEGIGATANAAGLWLGVSLPFLLWLTRRNKVRWVEVSLSLVLIAISQARAAYLLAIFSLLVHAVSNGRGFGHYLKGLVRVSAIVFVVCVGAYYLPLTRGFIESALERVVVSDVVSDAGNAVRGEETLVDMERVWTFEQGWQAFTEHPILGVGFANIAPMVEDAYGAPVMSHNILLTLIAESGWPAFILFIVLVATFARRLLRARKNLQETSDAGFYTACLASVGGSILSGMAHPILGFPPFYLVLGIGLGAARTVSQESWKTRLAPAPQPVET